MAANDARGAVDAGTVAAQGVKEYEPRVVTQLLDFVYRYVTDVLQDAEVC
jgi:hypothetical protein